MKRPFAFLIAASLVFCTPAWLSSVVAADSPATPTAFPHVDQSPRGLDSRVWDDEAGSYVSQRLLWEPTADANTVSIKYWRDGSVVVDGSFELKETMAVWDATVVGNTLRIERSVDGMAGTNEFLRVWINGTQVPAYGDWFLATMASFSQLSADGLAHDFLTEEWIEDTLALLIDPDRYFIISNEFADLIGLWHSMLGRYDDPAETHSCFFCVIGILGYIAEAGLVLSVGAPSGGTALALWLITRYSAIAGTIHSCVSCAISVKESLETKTTGMLGPSLN